MELRHLLELYVYIFRHPGTLDPNLVTLYVRSRATLCMGRLLCQYLDAKEALSSKDKQNLNLDILLNDTDASTQAYASLAALYWIRCLAMVDDTSIAGKVPILRASHMIAPRLRDALMASEEAPSDKERFAGLRLWAMFVGAWAEQRESRAKNISGAQYGWFNVHFARQVKTLELRSWEEVRAILQNFLHFDGIEPHPLTWFWRTIHFLLMSEDDRQRKRRQSQEDHRSTTPPSTKPQFIFVDSSADRGRSREAIRVHVMRESHRARRAGQGHPEPRGELQLWDSSSPSSNASTLVLRTRHGIGRH